MVIPHRTTSPSAVRTSVTILEGLWGGDCHRRVWAEVRDSVPESVSETGRPTSKRHSGHWAPWELPSDPGSTHWMIDGSIFLGQHDTLLLVTVVL